MFSLTEQERMVVFILLTVLLVGASLDLLYKKYPELKDSVNLIEGDRLYFKTDINTATFEELVKIPYIGEYTAQNIIAFREVHGEFQLLSDLKKVKGIRDKNYVKFIPHLTIR